MDGSQTKKNTGERDSGVEDTLTDRQGKYGHPADHFGRTTDMLNALGVRIIDDDGRMRKLNNLDWPLIMICDKIAREMGPERHADNIHDIKGYARCFEMIVDRAMS